METVGALAQLIATVIIAMGLIYTINDSIQAKKDNEVKVKEAIKVEIALVKEEITHVKDSLVNPADGLRAIKGAVDEQKLYCAATSSALKERVFSLEKKTNGK